MRPTKFPVVDITTLKGLYHLGEVLDAVVLQNRKILQSQEREGGRGRGHMCPDFSSNPSSSQCCSSVRKRGWLPPAWDGYWGFPRPGGAVTDGATAMAEVGWEVGIHLGRGGESGGGVRADGNLYSEKVEYSHAVYCNATDSGPV